MVASNFGDRLGGLRRWALWGAHAHRTNYEEQIRYFSLESKDSIAMLQKERKGTLDWDQAQELGIMGGGA